MKFNRPKVTYFSFLAMMDVVYLDFVLRPASMATAFHEDQILVLISVVAQYHLTAVRIESKCKHVLIR